MTKREAERQTLQADTLRSLGFTYTEAESLRRISLTLHCWHELECGVDNGGVERDETTGKVYWVNAMTGRRSPYPDRETGALRRLKVIIDARNKRVLIKPSGGTITEGEHSGMLTAYVQTDPRGAALYIIRPGDVPDGASVDSYYSRGICVY